MSSALSSKLSNMSITWTTHESGRGGELVRLNTERNDATLPQWRRRSADKAIGTIAEQLKDAPLMRMRRRLIHASRANDETEVIKITKCMREYLGEDQETGL